MNNFFYPQLYTTPNTQYTVPVMNTQVPVINDTTAKIINKALENSVVSLLQTNPNMMQQMQYYNTLTHNIPDDEMYVKYMKYKTKYLALKKKMEKK